MKKILCPSCGEIIEVEDDKETVYCPKCFKNIIVEQGQKHLGVFIMKHFGLAMSEFHDATEYQKAAKDFQSVLDIVPDNSDAAEGLVLATISMSTVRESHVQEAMYELQRYSEALSTDKFTIERSAQFIKEAFTDLDKYQETLKTRLMGDGHFYEVKGEELYKKALQQIIDFKEEVIELYFKKEDFPNNYNLSKESIRKDIKDLKDILVADYHVESSPFHLLYTDVEECYVEDKVFRDVRNLYKVHNKILAWSIISAMLLVVGIVLIFVLPKYLLIGVPIASVGLVMTIIFSIIYFSIQKKLSQ